MAHIFTTTISDEEYKALNLIVPDADKWVEDAILNKVRKCLIHVVNAHVVDSALLDIVDADAVKQIMLSEDDVFKSPKNWSDLTKSEIVKRTKMLSRKDRDLAEEAKQAKG